MLDKRRLPVNPLILLVKDQNHASAEVMVYILLENVVSALFEILESVIREPLVNNELEVKQFFPAGSPFGMECTKRY